MAIRGTMVDFGRSCGFGRTAARRLAAAVLVAVVGCGGGSGEGEAEGWEVTVYYTAVESFHRGTPTPVTGCPSLDCAHGDAPLGTYPEDFVKAVRDEGTGRITSGGYAGRYLNWSYDVGYWLDEAPRDTAGAALRPYATAAADADVLAPGTEFTLDDCGDAEVDASVCERLRGAVWRVDDAFTPGLGGSGHLDLYIGEEDHAEFTESPAYTTLENARITTRP
jgi:hypothetical protein